MATIEESMRLQLERAMSDSSLENQAKGSSEEPTVSPLIRTDSACLKQLNAETNIMVGNAGDHSLISQLFVQAYQASHAEDFLSRLDEPLYQPSDRLLLRRAGELVGHAQVSKLIGWFNGQRCPLARLQDFVTLPEHRALNFDASLLESAESVAVCEGAIMGLVRTDRPEWFEQQGWSSCRGQGHTRANTRAVLSHLDAQQSKRKHHMEQAISVRTWRHFELDSILKVYQQLSTNMWGALQRSLESWQWLVGRKAHDQILIAVETSAELTGTVEAEGDLSRQPNVVGYAIVRDSGIVEMLTLPGYETVRTMLLAQACRDAIDRDHRFVSMHTPAADPMHELLVTAGGSWIVDNATGDGQWMFKLLAPERWVERLYPVLHERAREAEIVRPLEIDFAIGDNLRRLTLTRRSARLEPITSSNTAIQCNWHALQDLLMSNLAFPEAIAQGRLRTPHLSLLRILAALFPPKLFWQSPFPMLRL